MPTLRRALLTAGALALIGVAGGSSDSLTAGRAAAAVGTPVSARGAAEEAMLACAPRFHWAAHAVGGDRPVAIEVGSAAGRIGSP